MLKFTDKKFEQIVANIPPEVKLQVEWQFRVSERIYEIMQRKGLTSSALARLMHKSEPEVSRWISGQHNFTLATLAKISSALGENIISI